MNSWIDVNEKEPQYETTVWMRCELGHIVCGPWGWMPIYRNACGAPITHWKPLVQSELPAPPKTEDKHV